MDSASNDPTAANIHQLESSDPQAKHIETNSVGFHDHENVTGRHSVTHRSACSDTGSTRQGTESQSVRNIFFTAGNLPEFVCRRIVNSAPNDDGYYSCSWRFTKIPPEFAYVSQPGEDPKRYQLVMKDAVKTKMMSLDTRVTKLQRKNESLQDEVHFLREALNHMESLHQRQESLIAHLTEHLRASSARSGVAIHDAPSLDSYPPPPPVNVNGGGYQPQSWGGSTHPSYPSYPGGGGASHPSALLPPPSQAPAGDYMHYQPQQQQPSLPGGPSYAPPQTTQPSVGQWPRDPMPMPAGQPAPAQGGLPGGAPGAPPGAKPKTHVARSDFRAYADNELDIYEGDLLEVVHRDASGWTWGRVVWCRRTEGPPPPGTHSDAGWFPDHICFPTGDRGLTSMPDRAQGQQPVAQGPYRQAPGAGAPVASPAPAGYGPPQMGMGGHMQRM